MRRALLLLPLLLAACAQPAPLAPEAPGFRETVERHIAAIETRDMDRILATITDGEGLTLIFPDGSLLATRAEYIDFHEDWFADRSWTMDIDIVRYTESRTMGVALVRTSYQDAGPQSRRDAYLALVFALEDGQWRLVHDQNTRIPAGS